MSKKYLSEIMKDVELTQNTLVVAPTGSGKTHYIINELCKDKKVLYLCDNSNLEEQVSLEDNTRIIKYNGLKRGFDKANINIMTYKYFGSKIKYDLDDDYINSFDIIIADEVHNLVDYQSFTKDADLSHAIKSLMKKYDNTLIYMFTATPYYLDELKNRYKGIDKYFKTIDLSRNKDIRRYVSLSTVEFTSYKQIPKMFENNRENFEFCGRKALVYTTSIDTMNAIEESLDNEFLKPICIWSSNNDKHIMNSEQIKVRNHLISTGELLNPYNVLIINRATETGINIYDKDMLYCVINTTNITQQVQARGRIRHDIVELRLRSGKSQAGRDMVSITLPSKWINKPLDKDAKLELCKELNLFDRSGRLLKWTTIKNLLTSKINNYSIEDKQIILNNKRSRISIITM